jgi:hypothetical protein
VTPSCAPGAPPDGWPSCAGAVALLRIPQPSLTIVCAWCQQTIRGQRTEEATRGLISHSICFACFADVLQELDPANALPPVPTKTETAPLASYLRLVP